MNRLALVWTAFLIAGCSGGRSESANSPIVSDADRPNSVATTSMHSGQPSALSAPTVSASSNLAGNQAAARPARADEWAGSYGRGSIRIAATSRPNRYRINVVIQASDPPCGGEVEGEGVATGNRIAFAAPVPDGGQCTFSIEKSGSTLAIVGQEGCSGFHGASCDFEEFSGGRRD